MRIRSYLALLVLACLLGAYMLEQVLGYHYNHVQTLASKYTQSLLLAKDFERIENSASQFLVSTDLVIASGNTYLIFGAKNMGDYISTELSKLQDGNLSSIISTEIKKTIINIQKINNHLDTVGKIPEKELIIHLRKLLPDYDFVSLSLVESIHFMMSETKNVITQEALSLKEEKSFIATAAWVARTFFLLLIIIIWWWANRKICNPLNDLIASSHKALTGHDFQTTDNAPKEITELSNDFKLLTQTLSHQASHDPLTELYNRRAFERNLNEVMKYNNVHLTVNAQNWFLCFIDLDYFKTINDTCGHAVGDQVLVNVARILKQKVRSYDTVARLGGDEFAILINRCPVDKALDIAEQIKRSINQLTYHCQGEDFQLSASIGIAPKKDESSATELLNSADIACGISKKSGRNCVHLFEMNQQIVEDDKQQLLSVHHLNNALNNDLFVLYKQDIIPLQKQKVGQSFEILLRMLGSEGQLISPACFLPVAERYLLTSKIDRWVINAVCEHFISHHEQLTSIKTIAINLSGHSLTDTELETFIISKLTESLIPADKICFEITETAAIKNITRARLFMENIKALGCQFALDDFGSGHSSYAYIKQLPTDKIKIDGAIIANMLTNPIDFTAVKSICEIGKAAKQEIIAEFVENNNLVEALTALGVDYAQGYYFAKPEPLVPQ
ncbi:EAL domain-containing protein [Psychromonas sp. SP041]|uniref:putative bifunctional diguanylate cyclase/phosphodiesterase n=1 Tax=Psychromonas sp. SP041 TaxID=1365007 RepID=UPI0003F8A498|nr:EAL domain-containing protein [Psychromonas sp. SP041]